MLPAGRDLLWSFVMPLNPEARRARARLAAHRRWHPGDDLDQLTEECYRELELSGIDSDIDSLVARAAQMTAEQIGRLRRLASLR
jgi:hypothetical protein